MNPGPSKSEKTSSRLHETRFFKKQLKNLGKNAVLRCELSEIDLSLGENLKKKLILENSYQWGKKKMTKQKLFLSILTHLYTSWKKKR